MTQESAVQRDLKRMLRLMAQEREMCASTLESLLANEEFLTLYKKDPVGLIRACVEKIRLRGREL